MSITAKGCNFRPVNGLLLAMCLLTGTAGLAKAEDPGWNVRAGLGAALRPLYHGADEYEWIPAPLIHADYKHRFYVDTIKGIGWNAVRAGGFSFGPYMYYAWGRDDKGPLAPLERVDGGIIAGLTASYKNSLLYARAAVAKAVTGDIDGLRARLILGFHGNITRRLRYAIGPSITWANDDWNDALFSLSAEQARRVGIQPYIAGGGVNRVGINIGLTYAFNRHWYMTGFVLLSRLTGDAGDSSIVQETGDANQVIAVIALGYRF